jgi:hypothetical protein
VTAKVWIVGEGNNELGRYDRGGVRGPGVLEALLTRVCASGWKCTGKVEWNFIKKFRAGGAHTAGPSHGDYLNVLGLVLTAYEEASDAVAFSRDVDNDPDREAAVSAAIEWIRSEGWKIEVIGGVAKPAMEGWILALRGVPNTDDMSRRRASDHLAKHDIDAKSTDQYVGTAEEAALGEPPGFCLPIGAESLRAWLATAHDALDRLVRGQTA